MNRKAILSPSILAADFGHLLEEIRRVERGGAEWIHIDVMDGIFVPSISFGMPVIRSLRGETDRFLDVHLMITEPIRYIETFADCGADGITIHLEAAGDPGAALDAIRAQGKRVGLSIRPGTPVESVRPWLDRIDLLLMMSVEPGFGGQAYIPESTARIRAARELIKENGRDIDLEVDGGIGLQNAQEVLDAGANVLVAGSSVFRGDAQANAAAFMELLRSQEGICRQEQG